MKNRLKQLLYEEENRQNKESETYSSLSDTYTLFNHQESYMQKNSILKRRFSKELHETSRSSQNWAYRVLNRLLFFWARGPMQTQFLKLRSASNYAVRYNPANLDFKALREEFKKSFSAKKGKNQKIDKTELKRGRKTKILPHLIKINQGKLYLMTLLLLLVKISDFLVLTQIHSMCQKVAVKKYHLNPSTPTAPLGRILSIILLSNLLKSLLLPYAEFLAVEVGARCKAIITTQIFDKLTMIRLRNSLQRYRVKDILEIFQNSLKRFEQLGLAFYLLIDAIYSFLMFVGLSYLVFESTFFVIVITFLSLQMTSIALGSVQYSFSHAMKQAGKQRRRFMNQIIKKIGFIKTNCLESLFHKKVTVLRDKELKAWLSMNLMRSVITLFNWNSVLASFATAFFIHKILNLGIRLEFTLFIPFLLLIRMTTRSVGYFSTTLKMWRDCKKMESKISDFLAAKTIENVQKLLVSLLINKENPTGEIILIQGNFSWVEPEQRGEQTSDDFGYLKLGGSLTGHAEDAMSRFRMPSQPITILASDSETQTGSANMPRGSLISHKFGVNRVKVRSDNESVREGRRLGARNVVSENEDGLLGKRRKKRRSVVDEGEEFDLETESREESDSGSRIGGNEGEKGAASKRNLVDSVLDMPYEGLEYHRENDEEAGDRGNEVSEGLELQKSRIVENVQNSMNPRKNELKTSRMRLKTAGAGLSIQTANIYPSKLVQNPYQPKTPQYPKAHKNTQNEQENPNSGSNPNSLASPTTQKSQTITLIAPTIQNAGTTIQSLSNKTNSINTTLKSRKRDVIFSSLIPQPTKQEESRAFELKDINLNIRPKQLTMITGKPGSGKSSLIYALFGELNVTLSSIHSRLSIDCKVELIESEPWILDSTIKGNIILQKAYREHRLRKAIRLAGLTRDVKNMKKGYLSKTGRKGELLTKAQRVRLALARAVYQDHPVIVLDDVLKVLERDDYKKAAVLISELIVTAWAEKTVVVVSDSLGIAVRAEHIIYLNQGSILKEGKLADFSEFLNEIFIDYSKGEIKVNRKEMRLLREEVNPLEIQNSVPANSLTVVNRIIPGNKELNAGVELGGPGGATGLNLPGTETYIIEEEKSEYDSRFETVYGEDDESEEASDGSGAEEEYTGNRVSSRKKKVTPTVLVMSSRDPDSRSIIERVSLGRSSNRRGFSDLRLSGLHEKGGDGIKAKTDRSKDTDGTIAPDVSKRNSVATNMAKNRENRESGKSGNLGSQLSKSAVKLKQKDRLETSVIIESPPNPKKGLKFEENEEEKSTQKSPEFGFKDNLLHPDYLNVVSYTKDPPGLHHHQPKISEINSFAAKSVINKPAIESYTDTVSMNEEHGSAVNRTVSVSTISKQSQQIEFDEQRAVLKKLSGHKELSRGNIKKLHNDSHLFITLPVVFVLLQGGAVAEILAYLHIMKDFSGTQFITKWGQFSTFVLLLLASNSATFVRRVLMLVWSNRLLSRRVHSRVFYNLLHCSMTKFFQIVPKKMVLDIMVEDLGEVDNKLFEMIGRCLQIFARFTSTAFILYFTIGEISFLLMVLIFFVTIYIQNQSLPTKLALSSYEKELTKQLSERLVEVCHGLTYLRASKLMESTRNGLHTKIDQLVSLSLLRQGVENWLASRTRLAGVILIQLPSLTIFYLFNWNSEESFDLLILFFLLGLSFSETFHRLLTNFSEIEAYFTPLQRLYVLDGIKPEKKLRYMKEDRSYFDEGKMRDIEAGFDIDRENLKRYVQEFDSLVLKNVWVRYYGHRHFVLKGLSFCVEKGQKVGIIGRTGSGKSTLTKVIWGYLEHQFGEIELNGEPVSGIDLKMLRRQVNVVEGYSKRKELKKVKQLNEVDFTSKTTIFEGTLEQNLNFLGHFTKPEMTRILSEVGFNELGYIKYGLDFRLEEDGENVSDTGKRLIGLARSLLRKSSLIVMDEALMGFDEVKMRNLIDYKFFGKTMLVIAHRLSTVMRMDTVLIFDKGELLEQGPPRELINNHKSLFSKISKDLVGCDTSDFKSVED